MQGKNKKNFPITILILALLTVLGYGAGSPKGSQPQSESAPWPIVPPIVPMIGEYHYATQEFIEWIDDNPDYSTIDAEVKDGEPALYQVALTEKKTHTRVYYTNSEPEVQYLKSTGQQAYLTRIDFRAVKNSGQRTMYAFGFADIKGQPVIWRFIPASEPTEQGAGLTPQDAPRGLRVLYRDIGTLAGQGSAVQIAGKVSEAAAWPEVSSPPYFVAYRGALVTGMHMALLLPGTQSWKVVKSPTALQEGAEWEFKSDLGLDRQFKISEVMGDELTIIQTNRTGPLAGDLRLTVARNSAEGRTGFALESMSIVDGKHSMKIDFKPGLPLPAAGASGDAKSESAFQIDEDGHRKVIEGKILIESAASGLHYSWKPSAPAWAKKQGYNASLSLDPDGYKITVE